MIHLTKIRTLLKNNVKPSGLSGSAFCKTGPGSYAEHDEFMGVSVPTLRLIAKEFQELDRATLQTLLSSKINEERQLALFILTHQFKKAVGIAKDEHCNFYMQNLHLVNNWNLVDCSAHLILGAHIQNTDRKILTQLATSPKMWERRIAMVATWSFIGKNDLEWTFKIAKILLNDSQDLIHKAVGWMLREAGKKDTIQLMTFLDTHGLQMPRTMLRYAIEKFPKPQRKGYLARR